MNNYFGDPRRDVSDEALFLDADRDADRDDVWDDDPRGDPGHALLLAPAAQAALAAAVHSGLREQGCDGSLRLAERWALETKEPWPRLRRQLQGNGGYCDCEILFNVFRVEDTE